jgi:hypothetical protein
MRGLRECLIDERGRMIVDERMERRCRVNKVVDEGLERMVEKNGEMVQDEGGEESSG